VSQAEGVLITGVYGSGKSSVAAEIAYLLDQQDTPFALLDLDYLSWAGPDTGDRAAEIDLLSQNLTAIVPNYRRLGVTLFLLAYFVRDAAELQAIRAALDLPLKVVRLAVPLAVIEQRLASDVTSGRRDDLREVAEQIATAEGVGLEHLTIVNDRPVGVVAQEIMTFLACSLAGAAMPVRASGISPEDFGLTESLVDDRPPRFP
jgi:hypothetical protein